MGIKERIFGKKSIYMNADGTPKTISVGSTGGFSVKGVSPFKRNKRILEKYWKYYQGEGTVFASINDIAENMVMVGYRLDSDDEDAKKLIDTRFKEMDVDGILLENVIYTLVYGDAFIEKVMGTRNNRQKAILDNPLEAYIPPSVARLSKKYPEIKKNYDNRLKELKILQGSEDESKGYISYIKTVDPISIECLTDKKTGEKTGYKQNLMGKDTPRLKLDEVIHLGFYTQSNSPYHISLIGPSIDTIDRMVGVDEAVYYTTTRHAGRKYVITVGTEEEPLPPKEVFNTIKNDIEDINYKSEYIVPAIVNMDTIDEGGFPAIQDHASLFQKKAITGLMIPEEGLGVSTRGSTDATSQVREIMFERHIQAMQHKIATRLRIDLINPLLVEAGFDENIVHMKFRSITTRDEEGFAKWIGNLLRGFQFAKQKPMTINEIRDAFHLNPIEGGDDIEWGGTAEPEGTKIQPTTDE